MKQLFVEPLRSFLLLTIVFLSLGCAAENDRQDLARAVGSTARAIINGVEDTGHPYVGLLLIDASGGVAQSICTAVVVGSHTLLTTAHCCKPDVNNILQLEGKNYPVDEVIPHPDWVEHYNNDIGLIRVSAPLPVAWAEAGTVTPAQGMAVTLVGYGRTTHDVKPDGIKRKADNTIDEVNLAGKFFTTSGTDNGEGNSLTGDSGGPVLTWVDGREVVVGLISTSEDLYGTRSYHVTIGSFVTWLEANAAGDFNPSATPDGAIPEEDGGIPMEDSSTDTMLDDLYAGAADADADERRTFDDGCSMAPLPSRGWPPFVLVLLGLLYLGRSSKRLV